MWRSRLRVGGLVGFRARVREEVSRGLSRAALLELRREVEGVVGRVDALCQRRGLTPRRLPAPTRNAYRYLKSLDFERLPAGEQALGRRPRVRGLTGTYDRLLRAAGEPGADLEALRLRVRAALQGLAGAEAERLPPRSAAAHRALSEALAPGRLEALAATLGRVRALALEAVEELRAGTGGVLRLRLARSSCLWRTREGRGAIDITLSDGFAGAPDELLRLVLRWALGGDARPARRAAEAWLRRAAEDLPEAAAGAAGARGIAHDLDELFDAINREHFGGGLARPRLGWSAAPTFHKFGSYTYAEDRLVLSSTLDHPSVPRFVVASVLHHEMLHKALGLRTGGATLRAHTAEFRARERAFPGHAEASAYLEQLARRGRR